MSERNEYGSWFYFILPLVMVAKSDLSGPQLFLDMG